MFKSIKFQMIFFLVIQFATLMGIVLSTVYLVNLRQHDYIILNLSGQLRVIAQSLTQQTRWYLDNKSVSREFSKENERMYNENITYEMERFNEIVVSLKERSLASSLLKSNYVVDAVNTFQNPSKVPSITGEKVTLICKWNKPARNQMDLTARVWMKFSGELDEIRENNKESIAKIALYIFNHENVLTNSTAQLSDQFRLMMEEKLSQIKMLNQVAIYIIMLISFTILFIVYQRIFRPIDAAIKGFKQVALGDFSHQIPRQINNEIGVLTDSFNYVTKRISSMFKITDKINSADSIDEMLENVFNEFPLVFSVDWVGILRNTPNGTRYVVDREYSRDNTTLDQHKEYNAGLTVFQYVDEKQKVYCSGINQSVLINIESDTFANDLKQAGLVAHIYVPIFKNPKETAVLVLASRITDAYSADDLELLTNLGEQVAHSFEKTIGMESLVISAVKGLAKLAESRDPETGDHLYRMSHYSAFIADELKTQDKYKAIIDPGYVRHIFQFSPMHDIGKVGVEDAILLKPGKLTKEEFEVMQLHPTVGGQVLRRCEDEMQKVGRSFFTIGIEIAESHHEKFDGTGYPSKLSGEAIPLSARIVAVADVFDALTSKRPYKEAWPVEKAISLLHEESGKHFDPDVVDAFDRCLRRVMEIYDKYKHV